MATGRKRTPTHLRVVQGNPAKRALPANEPKPRVLVDVPEAPPYLSARAVAAWQRLAPMLHRMGVLTVADEDALGRLCECFADIQEARASLARPLEELVQENGELVLRTVAAAGAITYVSQGKNGSMIRTRPELALIADADRRFHGYLSAFGMTPSARAKISVSDAGASDPADQYFG